MTEWRVTHGRGFRKPKTGSGELAEQQRPLAKRDTSNEDRISRQ